MNLKKELKLYLREARVQQEELYYYTGYHFEDVKTVEELEEVKRLIERKI